MNLDHLIYAPSFIKGNNDIGTVELQTLAALDTCQNCISLKTSAGMQRFHHLS